MLTTYKAFANLYITTLQDEQMNEVLITEQNTAQNESTLTIETNKLTFADWQEIAGACENSEKWGLFKWLENSSDLKSVDIEGWKRIAQVIGYSKQWAAKMYMEHSD